MNNTIKILILFAAGGMLYAGIEVLYRGFTHISMFITGGICFILIGLIRYLGRDIPVTVQMIVSAVIITLSELITGLIVNIWLGLNVWDYSDQPYNFMGQICLHASCIWLFLSFAGIYFNEFTRAKMFGERFPPARILP